MTPRKFCVKSSRLCQYSKEKQFEQCSTSFVSCQSMQHRGGFINSLWLINTMVTQIWVEIGSGNGLLPNSTKPKCHLNQCWLIIKGVKWHPQGSNKNHSIGAGPNAGICYHYAVILGFKHNIEIRAKIDQNRGWNIQQSSILYTCPYAVVNFWIEPWFTKSNFKRSAQ